MFYTLVTVAVPSLAPARLPPARPPPVLQRRSVLELGAAALTASTWPPVARAMAEDEPVKMYFGAGCFWHVQHEFILKEAQELERTGATFTAVSGYAGGRGLDGGRVCYHNRGGVADYGRLGHAEAVQVTLPARAVPEFTSKYIGLFGSRGYRHDPQDQGGEYRSVLGLPGGVASPLYPMVEAAAQGSPMKLVAGRGSEGDTLGSREILVMDSTQFPFYPAELYHQFHNDFMGPPYGTAYNKLQNTLAEQGRIGTTGCPEERF